MTRTASCLAAFQQAQRAPQRVFDRLPARWEVGELPDNLPAQAFWHRVIAHYTGDQYRDQYVNEGDWEGFVQCFDNRAYAAEAAVLHGATDDALQIG